MSKAVSRGQALQVSARVATQILWDELDGNHLQQNVINLTPEEFGRRFTTFLQNGCRVIIGDLKSPTIDRLQPFKFVGASVTIWRGPADGNGLEGAEEQDARSLALTKISLADLRFEHMLKGKETRITGEEKLARHIAAGHIRLDAKIAQTFYQEPGQVTLRQLHQIFGVTWMEFPGTTLRYSNGDRFFLCLCRRGDGSWGWGYRELDGGHSAGDVSALLASPQVFVS